MILKQVIHYQDTNSVEATWVEIVEPEKVIPAHVIPASVNPSTGDVIPESIVPEQIIPAVERTVKCHSYADVQMQMLRDDLGEDAAEYEELISLVEANIKPPEPVDPRIAIYAQIAAIEGTITNRRLREAALTDDGKAWLAERDSEIAVFRAKL